MPNGFRWILPFPLPCSVAIIRIPCETGFMESPKVNFDLNALVQTYDIDNEYEHYKRLECLSKLSSYKNLNGANVLELGSASGQMTSLLSQKAKRVVAVDGSKEFIDIAKYRNKEATNVSFYESYFESLSINQVFDIVVMHHILEHIQNPEVLLARLHTLMHDDSLAVITVPNAHALSRQLAVKMGLLQSVYELTQNDLNHGHFRVYDWPTLIAETAASGFAIVGEHGLSFKLFADKQNLKMLKTGIIGDQQLKGLWMLADDYKQLAGAIMVVIKKQKQ